MPETVPEGQTVSTNTDLDRANGASSDTKAAEGKPKKCAAYL